MLTRRSFMLLSLVRFVNALPVRGLDEFDDLGQRVLVEVQLDFVKVGLESLAALVSITVDDFLDEGFFHALRVLHKIQRVV